MTAYLVLHWLTIHLALFADAATPTSFLQFGQMGGIIFIAYTVIKQRNGNGNGNGKAANGSAGAQPKEYWILQMKEANEPILEKLEAQNDILRDIRTLLAREHSDPRSKAAGMH